MGCNTREENAAELAADEERITRRESVVRAAQAAIDSHKAGLGVEGEDETQLWHLIASLLEWCDAKNIDFDLQLELVREYYRTEG
jgi:hypothetical protein